ncbi:MAG: 2-hydroxycyclohexanecarboxyl-CoA dehydrogenase [Gammaproteobacteria bacterium]|jgi:2-hydroxycyclohexanecarboxyl-CoA dehydrogenase
MRGLNARTAIVTGGASGIGRAICLRLGEEGCKVGVFDVNLDGARAVADTICAGGPGQDQGQDQGHAQAFAVDISDLESVRAAVAAFEAAFGPTEVLVNNAGWDKFVPFLQTGPELWQKLIGINLLGPIHLHHTVLPGMVERGAGAVINICSDAGRVGSSGEAVYSATKGGIIAFTKTLAREHARDGIRLNSVCPGPTDTPLLASFFAEGEAGEKVVAGLTRAIPVKRLGQPNDYPGIVAFLASDDAGYITGQTISVSGGLTMHG